VSRPPLALTLGDPAGIGPEIVVKAWRALREDGPPFLVVGDFQALAAASPAGSDILRRVTGPGEAATAFPEALPVLDIPLQRPVVAGRGDPAHAAAVIRWIETAAGLALSGEVAGMVTAPIAKAPLYAAGFRHPGHTEFLAELAGGDRPPVMMLSAGGLRAVLATIHLPLEAVPGGLTREQIVEVGQVTAEALKVDFGLAHPRLAVAALNPHGGEAGSLGLEEIQTIRPAAVALRALGVDCGDPKPADTLFHPEARATYDAVICMYHDQALIPVKMLDFWGGVNVTLGLSIVRTSPDHGVGYDIAGRGLARADSLIAAIRMAADISARRQARAAAAA
jgi:4-hydroxythreonine-4-phosphate dehydrogenase